jgi:hypothetical protein
MQQQRVVGLDQAGRRDVVAFEAPADRAPAAAHLAQQHDAGAVAVALGEAELRLPEHAGPAILADHHAGAGDAAVA